MTPEQKEEVRRIIREEFRELLASDRYIFHKTIQILDGRNIIVGTGNGTKIATESTQKLGFWGVTPIVQPTLPSVLGTGGGDVDGIGRTAINSIRTLLINAGIGKA